MPPGCELDLRFCNSARHIKRGACANGLGKRFPGCRKISRAIQLAACFVGGGRGGRVFGPPVRSEDGLGVCELCFQGATDEEIAACEMNPDPDDLESALVYEVEEATGVRGQTIVAFCLAS